MGLAHQKSRKEKVRPHEGTPMEIKTKKSSKKIQKKKFAKKLIMKMIKNLKIYILLKITRKM